MKKLVLVLVIALAFSTTARANDIAFYVGAPNVDGWYDVASMEADVATIIAQTGSLFVDIQQFNDDQFDAFGAWVEANTDDGEMDILWLNGCVPSVLYPLGNAQPDGSLIEEWLDGGNMVINVGDWFGYVSYEGGARSTENGTAGAANILDLAAGIIVSADNTSLTVTPTGKEYLPSLGNTTVISYRPVVLSAVVAPWEVAAAFASTGGTDSPTEAQADPVVIHNTETGAYVAFVNQAAGSGPPGWLDDRGLTCAEFIRNWVATVIGLGNRALAADPIPEDEAVDVPRDVVLGWTPGVYAVTHDVYFGTAFDDVNDGAGTLVSPGQTATSYDPEGLLDFGQTYYWRIDEVNGAPDKTIFKGDVWSFTAEPFAYPLQNIIATSNASSEAAAGPENTVNGSGLNALDQHSIVSSDMWLGVPSGADPVYIQYEFDDVYKLHEMLVWNYNVQFELMLGFGLKDVTVEYSENGTDWTALGDVQLAQATAKGTYAANTTVEFNGVAAKYVKLTVNSGYGMMGQFGLSEVRFMYIPAQAREPQPASGATNVNVDTALAWRAGREAVTHEVYFGTDAEALALVDTVSETSYDPGALDLATTYYWQITEIQEVETWAGNVWSFTTQEYIVVEDFESYDDDLDAGTAIFQTWIDGWENDTGSTVGHIDAPFAEETIVHSGGQSMPLFYDNPSAGAVSEADLTLTPAQNWTPSGIKSLSLWFRGAAGNTGTLYIKINNTKVTYDGPATDIGIAGWQRWNIVLADTGANLSNVTSLIIGVDGAGSGVVYIDDIRLLPAAGIEPEDIGFDIAISTLAGWFGQDAADREMLEIMNNVPARIKVFTGNDLDGLADWVAAHTGDGASDLLILCGQFPDTIYGGANAAPDGSLAELFLDDGNTIVNTGDYTFYVNTAGSNNAEGGIQNMMDIPTITMWDDDTAVTVTAEGQTLTPSLQDFATDRPFHLDELEGDWVAELVLAQNAEGTRADPVIVRNSVTGGRLGIFYQTSGQDDDPRGEVISEWINNWYLDAVSGGN